MKVRLMPRIVLLLGLGALMAQAAAAFYAPPLGRWLTRDPIGYRGGTNLYGYVGNDPINNADPAGLARGVWNRICEGWRGCWEVGPIDAWDAAKGTLADDAFKFGKTCRKHPKDTARENACRHCYWQARLTYQHGVGAAIDIGNAHEYGEQYGPNRCDSRIDQINNAIGQGIGEEINSIAEIEKRCREALESGELVISGTDPRVSDWCKSDPSDSSTCESGDSSGGNTSY